MMNMTGQIRDTVSAKTNVVLMINLGLSFSGVTENITAPVTHNAHTTLIDSKLRTL